MSQDASRWGALGAYCALLLVNQAFVVQFAPLLSRVQVHYGVGEGLASLLVAVFPLVYLLSSVPSGLLIDRRGFRFGIGLGAAIQAVCAALRIYDASFALMLAAQLGIALAQPLILNGISKLVLNRFPEREVPLATGLGTLCMFFGMALGLATTAPLERALGLQGAMTLHAALALTVAGMFAAWARERGDVAAASESPLRARDVGKLLARPELARLIAVSFVALGVFNGLMTWLEPMLAPRGLAPVQAGIIGGAMVCAGAAGAVVLPLLGGTSRRKGAMFACVLTSSLLLAALSRESSFALTLAIAACLGFVFLGAFPLLLEACAEEVPAEQGASAVGLLMLAGNAGGLLYIALMPTLRAHGDSYQGVFALLAGSMLAVAVLVVQLRGASVAASEELRS